MKKITKADYYMELLEQTNLEVNAHHANIDKDNPVDYIYEEKLRRFNDLLIHGFNDFLKLEWVDETRVSPEEAIKVTDGKRIYTPDEDAGEPDEFICLINGKPSKHSDAGSCLRAGGSWELVE